MCFICVSICFKRFRMYGPGVFDENFRGLGSVAAMRAQSERVDF